MTSFVSYRGAVYTWHCDHVGHMNVIWYVGKFDEASWNFLAQLGITPSYLRENECRMAAVQQIVSYKRQPLAGDMVETRSHLLKMGESPFACMKCAMEKPATWRQFAN
jgi:acyl-CoA thioester hydrolase